VALEDRGTWNERMAAWRRHLHAHPETAFAETATAAFVAERLREFGFEVETGVAGTGVVGRLRNGDGPTVALRADLDALALPEENDFPHRSTIAGRMHGCGHDGHVAMLLGAAAQLSATRRFRGSAVLLFQPAEETDGGARRMIAEGVLERYGVEAIFGLHNWPGVETGRVCVHDGPVMASIDSFAIEVRGRGTHAAMPHLGDDTILAAAQIVCALQAIVSRACDPLAAAVLSVTELRAGTAHNVLPGSASLSGTVRALDPEVRAEIARRIERIARGVCAAAGCECGFEYHRRVSVVRNHDAQARQVAEVATALFGAGRVQTGAKPSMGAEDFALFLERLPGCYFWIGNGADSAPLHNGRYDFNDAILPVGAALWVALIERLCPA
jgi:hippurate hydrolase